MMLSLNMFPTSQGVVSDNNGQKITVSVLQQ